MSIHKIEKKSGVRYKVYLRGKNKKQLTKTFKRKIDAEKWEREQLVRLETPNYEVLQHAELTFQELVGYWEENHASLIAESTQQRYQQLLLKYLLPEFGKYKVVDIQTLDVDRWFLWMQRQTRLAPKTINHTLNLLRGIFRWGMQRFRFPCNPCDPVRSLRLDPASFSFWSEDEVERFLVASVDDPYYPLYVTALNTGMRLGELTGLQWDCVDLERRLLRVTRTWCNKTMTLKNTTKGRKARLIPINETLRQLLVELKLKSDSPWVLTRPGGERLDSDHFTWRHFRQACKRADVSVLRFHDLRHTFASHFMMRGGNIYDLQKILGHSSVTTTERYAHLSPDHLQAAASVVEFNGKKEGTVLSMDDFLAGMGRKG